MPQIAARSSNNPDNSNSTDPDTVGDAPPVPGTCMQARTIGFIAALEITGCGISDHEGAVSLKSPGSAEILLYYTSEMPHHGPPTWESREREEGKYMA